MIMKKEFKPTKSLLESINLILVRKQVAHNHRGCKMIVAMDNLTLIISRFLLGH